MGNRRKGVALLLALLLASCHLTGCSVTEFLSEVPGTMQVKPYESEEQTAEVNSGREAEREKEADSGTVSTDFSSVSHDNAEVQSESISFLSEDAFCFAYESLSTEEKLWYQDMEQALGSMTEKVRLSEEGLTAGLNESCIDKIFQCVLIDHPEIFYVDGYTYTKYSRGEKTVAIDFSGNYQLTPREAALRKTEIEQAAEKLLANLPLPASDYDKVKYVFETLIRNTEYDLNAPDNQNIYSVFVGGASVCQGYAKATQYLLNRLGVNCTLVQGKVENGEGHAWNLVRVDGSFYYVDTTWGDASYQREDGQDAQMQFLPEINYDYLCVTTGQLLRTHTLENIVPLPECVDTAANYYVRQGALFERYDREQMKRLFEESAAGGSRDVTIKCADMECYNQIKKALIEEQEIFDYLPDGEASVSYAHNEKQLSLTFWVTN